MRVRVDGEPYPLLGAPPSGVAALISEIDDVLEHRGRGIQQISINDESWSLDRLEEELDGLSIGDVKTLDVQTESMSVLVEESLLEVEEVIDELPSACHSLAALLTGPDRAAALDEYESFVEIWGELFQRHVEALDALDMKASRVSIDGVALDTWQARAWNLVERGATLAAAADAVALADLLTYELIPYAEAEASVLEQLRALTRQAQSG